MAYSNSKGLVQVLDQTVSPKVWVTIPNKYISFDNYKITPDQAIDLDSYVTETGKLYRNVLSHTRSKIEFTTPIITSTEWNSVLAIIKKGYYGAKERNLRIKYYNPETDDYSIGTFYRPDIDYGARWIDEDTGVIQYDGIRVAFIEY